MHRRLAALLVCLAAGRPARPPAERARDRAAKVLFDRGDRAAALATLKESVARAPDYLKSHQALFDLAQGMGRVAEVAAFARALPAGPRAAFRRALRLLGAVAALRKPPDPRR